MLRNVCFTVLFVLIASPVFAAKSLVVVTNEGDIDGPSVFTARQIFVDELRKHDIDVAVSRELENIHVLDASIVEVASKRGADTIYRLSLSRLGDKILALAEQYTAELDVVRSRRMTARWVEELDLVLPRLVRALVEDLPEADTAKLDSVTAMEGRRWGKRTGEFSMALGLVSGVIAMEGGTAAYGVDMRPVTRDAPRAPGRRSAAAR